MSIYAKLYPNLNFNQKISPATLNITRARSVSPNIRNDTSNSEKNSKVEQIETKKVEFKIDPPQEIVIPEPPKCNIEAKTAESEPIVVESVKNVEPELPMDAPKIDEPKPKAKPSGKRVSKISIDEKRQKYIDRLSRKSVKSAEKEMANVERIIEETKGDVQQMDYCKKELKRQMKLIDVAKFFANQ